LNQNRNNVFQAYEQASYNIFSDGKEGKKLPESLYQALKNYLGEKELPYYSLTANGVRFKQFVGAIQLGKYCVEVLPKIDRINNTDNAQNILITMLRQAGLIEIKTPTESNLRIKHNYILEAYINMFLAECEVLIHKGLIKTYRTNLDNQKALKGNLIFSQQITRNLVHAERFYVSYTSYDRQHPLNRILFKTLNLIGRFELTSEIQHKSANLKLYFPEMSDINVSDDIFCKLIWGRKNEAYKKAIEIARLLLLNYHPDLSSGKNHVLALMFDMNDLWEQWFTKKLKKAAFDKDNKIKVLSQIKSRFWFGNNGEVIGQKPDVLVILPSGFRIIIDTKWKLVNSRPSEDDIRQMFAYNKLFGSTQAYLVYPGSNPSLTGDFFDSSINGNCGLEFISFVKEGKLNHTSIEYFLSRLISK
jgi:5-methylcytosine-specific restriction enzyme subunit McrC